MSDDGGPDIPLLSRRKVLALTGSAGLSAAGATEGIAAELEMDSEYSIDPEWRDRDDGYYSPGEFCKLNDTNPDEFPDDFYHVSYIPAPDEVSTPSDIIDETQVGSYTQIVRDDGFNAFRYETESVGTIDEDILYYLVEADEDGENATIHDITEPTLRVLTEPDARLQLQADSVEAGESVLANAAGSNSGSFDIEYDWSVNGGNVEYGESGAAVNVAADDNPAPDELEITITVDGEYGSYPDYYEASDSTTESIPVLGGPTAIADITPSEVEYGQSVEFDASESEPNGAEIDQYRWYLDPDSRNPDFVSPNPVSEQEIERLGDLDVLLEVEDVDGNVDTDTAPLEVTNYDPTFDLQVTPSDPVVGEEITVEPTNVDLRGGELDRFTLTSSGPIEEIDFDPDTGTLVFVPSQAAEWEITITAEDTLGGEGEETVILNVDGDPDLSYSGSVTEKWIGSYAEADWTVTNDGTGVGTAEVLIKGIEGLGGNGTVLHQETIDVGIDETETGQQDVYADPTHIKIVLEIDGEIVDDLPLGNDGGIISPADGESID